MKADRLLIFFVFLALFLASCGNQTNPESELGAEASNQVEKTSTVTSAPSPTPYLEDKEIAPPTLVPSESPSPGEANPTATISEGDSGGMPTNTPEPPPPTPTDSPETGTESGTNSTCQEKVAFFGDVTIPDGTFFH